eukprot:TRINITY_DN21068_c0_g1_i1.p1 TRINITY_DN21068_c0_g1~~TRINITY_DN21068_c0_g1_i1.p1  ORF type:complete len:265 (+),score=91.36 TRINITY_DN21068_c0_g1_i1:60-797(+)
MGNKGAKGAAAAAAAAGKDAAPPSAEPSPTAAPSGASPRSAGSPSAAGSSPSRRARARTTAEYKALVEQEERKMLTVTKPSAAAQPGESPILARLAALPEPQPPFPSRMKGGFDLTNAARRKDEARLKRVPPGDLLDVLAHFQTDVQRINQMELRRVADTIGKMRSCLSTLEQLDKEVREVSAAVKRLDTGLEDVHVLRADVDSVTAAAGRSAQLLQSIHSLLPPKVLEEMLEPDRILSAPTTPV